MILLLVSFDPVRRKVDLSGATEADRAFLLRKAVSGVAISTFEKVRAENPLVRADPGPKEAALPAGVASPTIIAAALEAALRTAFPEEEVQVRSVHRQEYVYLAPRGPEARCEVHDLPTPGLGRRLVEIAREKHGKGGVTACAECISRAREDARSSMQ